jgi:hypothetical protein
MISSASDEIPSTIWAYCSTFFRLLSSFPLYSFAFQLIPAEGNRKKKWFDISFNIKTGKLDGKKLFPPLLPSRLQHFIDPSWSIDVRKLHLSIFFK